MSEYGDRFPEGFLWGTASSAYQCEGGNRWCDWYWAERAELARSPGARRLAEPCGEAADFWNRFEGDFDIARAIGSGIHRISVEWSRVMPAPGTVNREALERYRAMLVALRDRGIEPMVCLHHFTLPAWIAERGGLLSRGLVLAEFSRFTRAVIETLGGLSTYWVTVNEPGILASCGYLLGTFPPFRKNYLAYRRALGTLLAMHRSASAILRGAAANCRIGVAHAFMLVRPWRRGNPLDRLIARAVSRHMNDMVFSGLPKESLDFLGLNYYGPNYARGVSLRPAREGNAVSDMGWAIDPRGLFEALMYAWGHMGIPLMVTENGIATGDDALRIDYIRDHVAATLDAIRAGADVRGYMYWALTDNFEWAAGFSRRFGLAGIDYATQGREIRPSGRFSAELQRSGGRGEP